NAKNKSPFNRSPRGSFAWFMFLRILIIHPSSVSPLSHPRIAENGMSPLGGPYFRPLQNFKHCDIVFTLKIKSIMV
ncbi:MAG: hypothetical protein FWE89_03630, partial [Syntrophaceae bacterium]|nr:hypothetical protein [Syntrophaceae bacterium]